MKKTYSLILFLFTILLIESVSAQSLKYGFTHDLSNGATHAGSSFSVSGKDIAPTGFAFNTDGSKMFMTGQSSHSVHQYALSNSFDITVGVTFESSYSVISNAVSPEGISFNSVGTLMYVLDSDGFLNQYTLSSPFDITTGVSFDDDVFVSNNLDGFTLSTNGSKLFAVLPSNDKVLQYTLTTPFDVSGGVIFDVNYSVGEEGDMQDIVFNPDGTKMFVVGFEAGGNISQYDLATPFDISSGVSFSGVSFSLLAEQPGATDIKFSADGKRLFSVGRTDDEVNQYNLNVGGFNETAINLGFVEGSLTISLSGDTFINANATLAFPNDYQITNLPSGLTPAMNVAADGLSAILTLTGSVMDHQEPHEISSLFFNFSDDAFSGGSASDIMNSFDAESEIGISFTDNPIISYTSSGAGFFTETTQNNGSVEETLTISITDDSFTNAGNTLGSGTDYTINNLPSGLTTELTVAANGLTASLVLSGNADNHQNTDDLSSLNFTFENSAFSSDNAAAVFNAVNTESQVGIDFNDNPKLTYGFDELELAGIAEYDGKYGLSNSGFEFSGDGMKLFLIRESNNRVNQYNLSSPYDLTSSITAGSIGFGYGIQTDDPAGLSFNPTGSKMYIIGDAGTEKEVNQYSLTTPYDVTSGVSFDNRLDVINEGGWLQQMTFSTDGMKLFIATSVVADNRTKINQYSLTTAYDVTSGVTFVDSWDDLEIYRPSGIAFNANGSKMLLSTIFGQIHTLTLTNPFDITSELAQSASTFDMSETDDRIYDLLISPDAKNVFVSGGTAGVHQFNLLQEGFQENEINDGSVEGSLVVRITEDTFINADGTLAFETDYTINNLPGGLIPELTVASDGLSATLTLSGSANNHRTVNNLSDLQFTFENSAFFSNNAGPILNITNANSGYGILFLDGPEIEDQSFNVDENSTTDTVVGTAVAVSADGALTFSITEGQSGNVFSIDPSSGEITVGSLESELNYEDVEVFNLTVEVTDGNFPSRAIVSISLNDLNEAPYQVYLNEEGDSQMEGLEANSAFTTIVAVDPDEEDTHTFALVSGEGDTDNNLFQIDGQNLINLEEFDFEQKEEYAIRIRATDASGLSIEDDFGISVININETPVISNQIFEVSESEGNGFVVGAIIASDPENDVLTFSPLTGEIGSVFDVGSDGVLTLNRGVDFEEEGPYEFIVNVSDDGTPNLESSASITVNVIDANEAPTEVLLSTNTIDEVLPAGTMIGVLSTEDLDAGDSHTYELVSLGADPKNNASFDIEGNELVSGEIFDFETKDSYEINVRSTDAGGLTREDLFVITINDLPTQVSSLTLSQQSILENQAVGSTIGIFTTLGEGLSGSFIYSLVAGGGDVDNSSFTVSGDQLITNESFDFESKSSYSVRVQTDDGAGNTLVKEFTIAILDETESSDANIMSFSLTEETVVAAIVTDTRSVQSTLVFGTTLSALEPVISISAEASISPTGAQDFSVPVVYTVTAEDGSTQNWTVTVTVAPNTANDILSFSLVGQSQPALIDGSSQTIDLIVNSDVDVSSLVPTITVPAQAVVTPTSGSSVDFTQSVTFTVTAGSGVEKEWGVNVVKKQTQDVFFNDPGALAYGGDPVVLDVETTSGETATLELVDGSDVVSLSGVQITIIGVGNFTIRATESGGDLYDEVVADQSYTVVKADLQIEIDDKSIAYNEAIPELTGNISGIVNNDNIVPVFTTTAMEGTDVGSYPINATFTDPDGRLANYEVIETSGLLEVIKADQQITIAAVETLDLVNGNTAEIVATTSSELALQYALTTGDGTITGNILTANNTGNFTITVSQAGNVNYNSASSSISVLVVDSRKMDQTITFETISDKVFGDQPFTLSATSSSGLDIVYSVVSGPISITANQVSITGAGTAVIAANQNGDDDFTAAAEVTQSFVIEKAEQIITITAIDDVMVSDDPINVLATVDSGLELIYEIEGPATISETTITLNGDPGEIMLTVSQDGNENYNPASATISFLVNLPTSIEDELAKMTVYPNPARNWLKVDKAENTEATINIYSLEGLTVLRRQLFNDQNTIDVSGLNHGIYIVSVQSNNNNTTTKVLIEK